MFFLSVILITKYRKNFKLQIEIVYIIKSYLFTSGMTRDDLFNTNASIAMNLADACARYYIMILQFT